MATKKPTLYYLQHVNAGYLGNSPIWYGKAGNGYTQWIDEAETFTWPQARLLMRSTRGSHEWKPWKKELVDSKARRTVDIQGLRK